MPRDSGDEQSVPLRPLSSTQSLDHRQGHRAPLSNESSPLSENEGFADLDLEQGATRRNEAIPTQPSWPSLVPMPQWMQPLTDPKRQNLVAAFGIVFGMLIVWMIVILSVKPSELGLNETLNSTTPNSLNAVNMTLDRNAYFKWIRAQPRITFDQVLNGQYYVPTPEYAWVDCTNHEDGSYLVYWNSGIWIRHIRSAFLPIEIVPASKLTKPDSFRLTPSDMALSFDGKFVWVSTDSTARWRHSQFAHYYLFDVTSKELKSIHTNVLYAEWSPASNELAFVRNNDIYILSEAGLIRNVTFGGGENIFHGVADWVYEEEVLSSVKALWWSLDGSHLSYLRFDDTDVKVYELSKYEGSTAKPAVKQYPEEVALKYPKPGTPNPKVTLWTIDLKSNIRWQVELPKFEVTDPDDALVVFGVHWLPVGKRLLVQVLNRTQDRRRILLVDVVAKTVEIVRDERTQSWFEADTLYILPAPHEKYVAPLLNDQGMKQLALFDYTGSMPAQMLTTHDSEIDGGVQGYNPITKDLFYLLAAGNGRERHIYSMNLAATQNLSKRWKSNGTPDGPMYSEVNLTPKGQWLVLNDRGPDIPQQSVISTVSTEASVLFDLKNYRSEVAAVAIPKVEQFSLQSPTNPSLSWNVKIIYPLGFNANRTRFHPLLVNSYGGPNSQTVNEMYKIDIHTFLASDFHEGSSSPFLSSSTVTDPEAYRRLRKRSTQDPKVKKYLQDHAQSPFVIMQIDARGTGFRGEAFRSVITKQLGHVEPDDVVEAVDHWIQKNTFVDPDKVGFWGWSYGGYLSTRIVERQKKPVFKAVVAVAPVTHWLFYDSIYTERYMKLPSQNPDGYTQSAVHDLENFKRAKYLVMHGTGDDNVHVQQTLHLLGLLQSHEFNSYDTNSGVSPFNYRGHLVEDDRHSMRDTIGAYWLVHRMMVDWFVDNWKEVDALRKEMAAQKDDDVK